MPSPNEIKGRINGVSETKKITDAMYMIASAKMRKAAKNLDETTPYFDALKEKIGKLFHYLPKTENRYFRTEQPSEGKPGKHGLLLITSDKGLAGAYNQEAIRLCEKIMNGRGDTLVFIVGEVGRQYFLSHQLPFCQDFFYAADCPNVYLARRICAELLGYYDSVPLDEISVIYTDYTANKPAYCRPLTLLPLDRTHFYQGESRGEEGGREFLPDPETVLDKIVPSYVMGSVYGCLVESYCSEQQARMNAMHSAGNNAEDILRELNLQYNKLRQAAITEEITEITAGAKAQQGHTNGNG